MVRAQSVLGVTPDPAALTVATLVCVMSVICARFVAAFGWTLAYHPTETEPLV